MKLMKKSQFVLVIGKNNQMFDAEGLRKYLCGETSVSCMIVHVSHL